ncbi:MAG TPA: DUF3108 domain-containing protein [Ignavibacteriaceae bacterium]|nr:DUF3108 domain-containing protein [Ignavibacteriaceae bacterium]HRQ54323.1 DUF3108 domain-containing protein [Ignavibacteriaceae bacterium]
MIKYLSAFFIGMVIVFLFGFSIINNQMAFQSKPKIIEVGEEITYVVKYLAFEIGEIKLIVRKEQIENYDTLYNAIAYINSYDGIPFVNLHQIYETKFDTKQISHYFKGLILSNDTTYTKYYFNKSKNNIRIVKGKERTNEIWTDSTISYERDYQDGLSLFYFARMRTGQQKKINAPVFINEKYEKTYINFYNEVEDMDIDAVDYDIACVRLDGETEFRGIFGLTGYFEGWFSNDEYAVPIVAKMQVIIGSITLELKEWKKKGWMPPKYQD